MIESRQGPPLVDGSVCQSQPSSDKQVEQRLLAEVERVCLKEGEKTWAGRKEMNELWEPKPEASLSHRTNFKVGNIVQWFYF